MLNSDPPTERGAAPDGRGGPPVRALPALAVFAVGMTSVVLLIGSDSLRHRTAARNTRLLLAMAEIQTSLALAHLWLEEYVSGDNIDIDDVFADLDHARELTETMLDAELIAPTQGALLNQVTGLRASIAEFTAIATERRQGYERSLPVGIGSRLDKEYDRVFDDLLTQAHALEDTLAARRTRQDRRSRLIFLLIVSSWSALITAAAAGLWTRERYRLRTQAELDHSRRQLFQSQKLEALGRLAGGLAHDINNYLAAIRAHCELVRMKQPAGDRLTHKMDSVIGTVQKASTLIDRLLVFSRRQPVELEVVCLDPVVDSVIRMTRPSLGEDVRVGTQLAGDLWNVEVDLAQIEQVLVNLLVNARDAMPTGGEIVVTTANRRLPDGREEVVVTVRDTGRGIAAEDLDQIFEPFWTTKGRGRGGGLGLATAYSIVRQHGGNLAVTSEVDHGTSFEVRLPRCRRPITWVTESAETADRELGGNERILLVDDNRDFRESTRALLEALGYRVTAAADGREALAAVGRDGPPDLVLTDVVMPGMSGPELIERLDAGGRVEVIFLSGHAEDVAARYGLDPEHVHFVNKQASITALASKIRDVLG